MFASRWLSLWYLLTLFLRFYYFQHLSRPTTQSWPCHRYLHVTAFFLGGYCYRMKPKHWFYNGIAFYPHLLHVLQHVEEDVKYRKARETGEGSEDGENSKNRNDGEPNEQFEEHGQKETAVPKSSVEPTTTSSPSQQSSTILPSPKPTSAPEPLPPFMTIPILSGLFVTSILLGILGFAISAMMDIKPGLRFDDPKGKTLTFSVSEWMILSQ